LRMFHRWYQSSKLSAVATATQAVLMSAGPAARGVFLPLGPPAGLKGPEAPMAGLWQSAANLPTVELRRFIRA
jgi:hypothetical protein